MKVIGQFHAPAILPPEKESLMATECKRLGGPQI
jgi:hypothetical protein